MSYALPRDAHLPDFESDHTVVPAKHNPLGTKGVGEGAAIGARRRWCTRCQTPDRNDSRASIRAYEAKLEKLEAEKGLITEQLATAQATRPHFDESLPTATTFLANLWSVWTSPRLEDRKTLLKLVFTALCHMPEAKAFELQTQPSRQGLGRSQRPRLRNGGGGRASH